MRLRNKLSRINLPRKSSFLPLVSASVLAFSSPLFSETLTSSKISQNNNTSELKNTGLKASKVWVNDNKMARKIAISFHHAILETNYQQKFIIADLTDTEIEQLKKIGLKIEPATDWNARFKTFNDNVKLQLEQREQGIRMAGIPGFDCYATVEETLDEGAQLATDNPDLAEWIDIGDSWEKENSQAGYDLMVLKLSNKNIVEEKPKLFIHSSMHAREYTPAALTLDFAKELLTSYSTDADIAWILDYHEIHILFHMNPDGRKIAETGVLHRKNTNQNHCPGPNVGVDLNRNFAYFWNSTTNGSSGFECDSTYRGSAPESEPETQAVSEYIRSLFPDVRGDNINDAAPVDTAGMHIDIHSFSELVLWPWGHSSDVSPNNDGFVALGNKFAWFNNYTPQQSVGLYPTDGTSDDVSYGELGIAAFTFELGTSFFQQCSDYQDTIKPDNLPALIYAAKATASPYLLAHGPEITNIELNGSDNSISVPAGTVIDLIATVDATRTLLATNGRTVSKVEYSLDTPIWDANAVIVELLGNDGDLSSGVELFDGQLDTTGLADGEHTLFMQSYDQDGNLGVTTAAKITITDNGLPISSFTANCVELSCDFDAAGSSDSDGTIETYSWDFGDSITATSQTPSHTYAAAGDYLVTLTVTDNEGAVGISSQTVTVTESGDVTSGGFTETALSPARGENLSFTIDVPSNASLLEVNTSGGTGDVDLVINFASAPTRTDNDCIQQGAGNTHSCSIENPEAGLWYIVVRGAQTSSGVQLDAYWTAEGTTNVAPTADFSFIVDQLEVAFTDLSADSDGSVTTYSWDFGDGNTSTQSNPTHNYLSEGTYTVVLTVTDNDGASSSTSQTVTTTSQGEAPTAQFGSTNNELEVSFTNSSTDSDGDIVSYLWDFGDGGESTETNPVHLYSTTGSYLVTLTATDAQGQTGTTSETVTVSETTGGNTGGFTETGLSPARGENLSYTIEVPNDANSLVIDTFGGSGNVDLVINFGSSPTRTNNDCIQQGAGNTHNCTITAPEAGTWFIIVRGAAASDNVQLDAYWFN